MTPEEWQLMRELCKCIAIEQDPKVFGELVHELNELLQKKEQRLMPENPSEDC